MLKIVSKHTLSIPEGKKKKKKTLIMQLKMERWLSIFFSIDFSDTPTCLVVFSFFYW